MNTKFNLEEIPSLKNNYKYNIQGLEVNDLNDDYSVNMLSNFERLQIQDLFEFIKYKDIYCFLHLPYWQESNRIVKFYKLKKYIQKKEDKEFDFILESEIENSNSLLYSGILKVTNENISELLDLIEIWKSGILFSSNASDFTDLISSLNNVLKRNMEYNKSNKADIINCLISYDNNISIIYPEWWDEYYINILNLNK
ncbi:hypothetical protein [Halarcobacter sp.]|uniref:hypothetical protein n=1 Tax=Halarcobacter sp. TaxID=2321133 RepID=UPI002AA933D5|nr:hypothetical protein [Halarcobacter sp.]